MERHFRTDVFSVLIKQKSIDGRAHNRLVSKPVARLKTENFPAIEILLAFAEDWGAIHRYTSSPISLVGPEDRIYETNFIVWNIDTFFPPVAYTSPTSSRMSDVTLKNATLNGEDVFASELRKLSLQSPSPVCLVGQKCTVLNKHLIAFGFTDERYSQTTSSDTSSLIQRVSLKIVLGGHFSRNSVSNKATVCECVTVSLYVRFVTSSRDIHKIRLISSVLVQSHENSTNRINVTNYLKGLFITRWYVP